MLILLLLAFAAAENLSPECSNLFKQYDPRPCCEIPNPLATEINVNVCKARCGNKTGDGCCYIDCLFEASGIITAGVYSENALAKLYRSLLDTMEQSVAKMWSESFWKAAQPCYDKSLTPQTLKGSCKVSELIENFNCIYQNWFLNCPVFNETKSCQDTKEFVKTQEKCGKEHGNMFIIDVRFWNPLGN